MLKRLVLLITTLVVIFSCAGVAAAQDMIRVAIEVKSEYAPKGYWGANFINFDPKGARGAQQFTESPVIENGRMLVPLRQIAEALGYSVIWEPNTQAIILSGKNLRGEDTNIQMNAGMSQASVNSKAIPWFMVHAAQGGEGS